MRQLFTIVVALLLISGCSRAREYELRGQVLAVDPARREITIKHEDVKGFMPAMTMPFKVRDAKLLEGRAPGDLVTATLVVQDADAHLSAIAKTGEAPLAEPAAKRLVDVLMPGDEAPDITLTDQQGKSRRLSDWRGRTVVVTFVYTRCPLPDFCPRMDRHFAEAQRAIMADPRLGSRVHLLSISFDPEYDTPAVLAAHAARVGVQPETWTYATGEPAAIDSFAARFGVSAIKNEKDAQEIVHNLRTAVIGGDGRIVTVLNGNDWTPADLLASVRDVTDGRR